MSNAQVMRDEDSVKSVFRPAGAQSNLADWAPEQAPVSSGPSYGIANLPEWNTLRPNDPTANPITLVQRDMDWSLRRLLSEKVFEELMGDALGRHRFREYLSHNEGTENKLDMWFDMYNYQKMVDQIRKGSQALHGECSRLLC